MQLNNLLKKIKVFLRPLGKTSFLIKLHQNVNILDVGCGNDSPIKTKSILPNCKYTGLDIINYNQSKDSLKIADSYILTNSKNFANSISGIKGLFDVVISTHNIEHCEERELVLNNLCNKVKLGGLIYLTFPSEDTINFPSRNGTLNYYDDESHLYTPPNFNKILRVLKQNNIIPIKKSKNYQPLLMRIYGNLIEPFSFLNNQVYQGTWEKWGFESIIIGKKIIL